MRVMLFVHSLNGRGIASVVTCIAERAASDGHQVVIVANSVVEGVEQGTGIGVVDLQSSERRTIPGIPGLRRAIRSHRPDVLYAHGNGPARAAVLATRGLAGRPHLVTIEHNHYSSYPWRFRPVRDLANRLLLPLADHVVGVAPEIVEELEDLFPGVRGKTSTIPPPFTRWSRAVELARADVPHPWFREGELPVVVSVANIHPRKDPETLVRAMVRVNEHSPTPARLALIGQTSDPQLAARLTDIADEGGIGEHVDLLGFQANPLAYVARSSIFALTSRNEGMPIALLESMALGIPIVSTDCPSGPRYLLEDGQYGELAPVGDVEGIAAAILRLLNEPERASRLGQLGKARVERFSPGRITEDYLDLVEHP